MVTSSYPTLASPLTFTQWRTSRAMSRVPQIGVRVINSSFSPRRLIWYVTVAPEVIELKGASTASDIWSLGCTVIELLTGKPPYAEIANGMSVMFHIVEDDCPPIPAGISEPLKDFFSLCFDKDPAKRPSAELLFEHPWLKKNWGINRVSLTQQSL